MSSRFGRRQKKKMREEILALNDRVRQLTIENVNVKRDYLSLRHENEKYIHSFEKIETILGPYFVGFEPKTVTVDKIEDYYSLPSWETIAPLSFKGVDIDKLTYKVCRLECSSVDIEKVRGLTHVRLKTFAGDYSYATNYESMKSLPRGYLIENLAQEFSYVISNKMGKL